MAVRVWAKWLVPSLGLALACGSSKGSKIDPDVPSDPGGNSVGASSTGAGGSTWSNPGFPAQAGEAPGPSTGGKSPIASGGGEGGAPLIAAGAGGAYDEPGILLLGSEEASVHESYGAVQYRLLLEAQPFANVEVGLQSATPSRAVVSPLKLTFTPENWDKPQNFVVSGVKDLTADGDHLVAIETLPAVSTDARYSGLNAADVSVWVLDDTDAGIVVGAVSGNTSEGGGQAKFYVVLASKPTAKVVLPMSSSDITEGTVPASLTFEPDAWSEPQAVTITGVDDQLVDGNQPYQIEFGAVASNDEAYAGLVVPALNLSNVDNDSAAQ